MPQRFRKLLTLLLASSMLLPGGCSFNNSKPFKTDVPAGTYEKVASQIEYPAESGCTQGAADESLTSPHPWTIDTQGTPQYWDMSLEEAIQLTLQNSRVLRDLGGAVVRAPDSTRTAMDPSVAETDPRIGVEAALSEFDAQFSTSTYWEKNDRALNNEFFGGGTRILLQDDAVFQAAITKKAVTGDQFTIRHNVDYDANNAPGNLFPSAWDTNVEAEIRHPFLQGGGAEFNRIAGPQTAPGVYSGVLIARLNTDVALADFEISVRDLVSNVENAYWDLNYGYRVLDARVKARDAALDTWRKIYALNQVNRRGGEAEKEAQARSQYFAFQQDVQNALSGEPYLESRNWNGLPSGAFQTTTGVLLAERRLRLLMGLSPADGKLIRPTDEPVAAKIDFDWNQITTEAATRRAELRKQKFAIRRRELELIASKNNLMPRLDGVGRYRWRGFGDTLFPDKDPPLPRFDNAYEDLTSGDFQEWQLGFELNVPIGFREAHVATRNAELLLARERAILRDQQREIMHEAADAISELDRAYAVLQTSYNRLAANHDQLGAVEAAYENDKVTLDLYLDAQRRVADSEIDYHLNRARYSLAAKNVHFVKGTLLEYDGVYLAEGPWPCDAQEDAARREALRGKPRPLNYASSLAPVVAMGPFDQNPSCPAPAASTAIPNSTVTPSDKPANKPSTPTDAQPLPTTPMSAPPTGGTSDRWGGKPKLLQPETLETDAVDGAKKSQYPVVGAGFTETHDIPLPQITLRPGAATQPILQEVVPAVEPKRLPATAAGM
ncbi:MAG TPA: TolC family protein [Lacipirellulaceae bacterium]|nr:TolC family protein [Lacipirellulaceae bacterium]